MTKTKWAVLIGIDHYPDLGEDDYQGCVHDVEETSEVLCGVFGFESDHILRLTSPQQQTPTVDKWPSYDNIVSSIRGLRNEVGPGDIVYIHFSGCVKPTQSKMASDRRVNNALDLALLPVDIASNKRCLHDIELAVLCHELTRTGASVTMVVDGRYIYVLETLVSKSSAFTPSELDALPHDKWTEDGRYTWLSAPDPESSYTLLLAVSIMDRHNHWEYLSPTTGEWGGHLTSLLHETIRSEGMPVKLRTLARRLQEGAYLLAHPTYSQSRSEIDTAGNMSRLFLADDQRRSHWSFRFPVLKVPQSEGGNIQVGAGSAHGIQVGAKFTLDLQLGPTSFPKSLESPRGETFQIEVVRGLTSAAVLLGEDMSTMARPVNTRDVTCSAILHLSSLKGASEFPTHGNKYAQQKMNIVTSTGILSPWGQARLYKHLLNVKTEDEKFSELVKVAILGGYRHNFATMPPDPVFGLVSPILAGGCLHLLSGDFASIYIQGLQGTVPKHLFVYVVSFDSDFGITQVYPNAHGDTARLIPKEWAWQNHQNDQSMLVRLGMSTARQSNSEIRHVNEVLKVFVTDQPTSFEYLELPGVTDEELLNLFSDPAKTLKEVTDAGRTDPLSVFFDAETSGTHLEPRKWHGIDGYDVRTDEVVLEEPPDSKSILEGSTGVGLDGSWCCFDLSFVIHKSVETLAQVE